MPTAQTAINQGIGSSAQVLPADGNRRYMIIQVYDDSAGSAYVKFGSPATAGNGGELKVTPGGVYIFGTPPPMVISPDVTYLSPAPPLETVNIIGVAGTAKGSILVVSG